jgi:hypothetical protein
MLNRTELEKREQTFVSTARCDIRTAASLLSFFQQSGFGVASKSQLFRLSLETLAQLVTSRDEKLVFSRSEALDFMNANGLLTGNERNRKNLFTKLQLESFEQDSCEPNERTAPNDNELAEASLVLRKILNGGR